MGHRVRHTVKLYQAGQFSRREYRNILTPIAQWCDEVAGGSNYSLYYCNRGERHSLWSFYNKDYALQFKIKFGGEYSEHIQYV